MDEAVEAGAGMEMAAAAQQQAPPAHDAVSVTAEALLQAQAAQPVRRRAHKAPPVVVKGVDGGQEVSINADLQWLVEWLQEIQDRAPRWLDAVMSASIKSGMTVDQLHELLARAPEWEIRRLQKMVQQTEHFGLAMDRTLDEDYTRVAVDSALERVIAADEGRGRKQEEPEAEVWRFLVDAWDRQVEAAKKIQAAFRAFKARHPERFIKGEKEDVKSRYMDDPRLQGTRRSISSASEESTDAESETTSDDDSEASTVDKTPPLRFPPIVLQNTARRTRAPPGPKEKIGFGSSSSSRVLKPEPPKVPSPTFRRKSGGGAAPMQPAPQAQPFRARSNPRHSDMGQSPVKTTALHGRAALQTVPSEELLVVAETAEEAQEAPAEAAETAEEAGEAGEAPTEGAADEGTQAHEAPMASVFATAADLSEEAEPRAHQEDNDEAYQALIKSLKDNGARERYDFIKLEHLHSRMREWQFQHASYSKYLLRQYEILQANDAEYEALVKSVQDSHSGRPLDTALLGKLHAQLRDRQFQQGQSAYSKHLSQQYEIAEKQRQQLPGPGDTRWPLLPPVSGQGTDALRTSPSAPLLTEEEPSGSDAAEANALLNDAEYEVLLQTLREQQQLAPLGSSGKKYDEAVLERLHATMRHRHYHQPGYAKCLLQQYEVPEHSGDSEDEGSQDGDEEAREEAQRLQQEQVRRHQALLEIELNQWRIEQEKRQRLLQLGELEVERQRLEIRKSQQLQVLIDLEAEREREKVRQVREELERRQQQREEEERRQQEEREERRRRFTEEQVRRQRELQEQERLEEEQRQLEERRRELHRRLEEEQRILEENQRMFELEKQRLAEERRVAEQQRLEQTAKQILENRRQASLPLSLDSVLDSVFPGRSRQQSESGGGQAEPGGIEGALLLSPTAHPLSAAIASLVPVASGQSGSSHFALQPLKMTESPIDSGTASPIASTLMSKPGSNNFGDHLATSLSQLSDSSRDATPHLGLGQAAMGSSSRLRRVSMPGAEDIMMEAPSSARPEAVGPELSFAPGSSAGASPNHSLKLHSNSTPFGEPPAQQVPHVKPLVGSVSQHGTPLRPADRPSSGDVFRPHQQHGTPAPVAAHCLASAPGRPSPSPEYSSDRDPLELMRLHLTAMQQSVQVMHKDVHLVQRKVFGSTGGTSSAAGSPMHLLGGGHVAMSATGGLLRKSQGGAVQLEDYLGEISKAYGPRRAAYLASAAGLMQSSATPPEHRSQAKGAHEDYRHSDSPRSFLPAIRSSNSGQASSSAIVSLRKPLAGGFNINASY